MRLGHVKGLTYAVKCPSISANNLFPDEWLSGHLSAEALNLCTVTQGKGMNVS